MPTVAVFGSSAAVPGTPAYADAVRLGGLLAERGLTVASGGYAGVMEAVSRGAREAGGEVLAVTAPAVFPGRTGANGFVSSEVHTSTIAERIHRLVDLADGWITMPGSIGTVTEFMVAWNDGFVARFRDADPKPHVAVGPRWRELVAFLADRFGADPSYVTCVDDVETAASEMATRLEIPGM